MGVGKTRQVIDAAQILFQQDKIDRVIVIVPAAVRAVWYDQELGELAKWLWPEVHCRIGEYHQRNKFWSWAKNDRPHLHWVITNYDFIRMPSRLAPLLSLCSERTLLVLDESSAVKNYRAKQTKACIKIRQKCGRVILLNGTPIAHSPNDLYSQGNLMHPSILDCRSYFHFRSRYGIMGGFRGKQIVQWQNLRDLQNRFKPYVLMRRKEDCLDLPEKLEPVVFTVSLTKESWEIYKEMRDEMIVWLEDKVVTASQAVVKALRLSQVTNGFIGGVQDDEGFFETKEIGREKIDFFLQWYKEQLSIEPDLKLLVWCRFRKENLRLCEDLKTIYGSTIEVERIAGGQKKQEREHALRLLDPRSTPNQPVVIIGSPQAGGLGLNLAAAHTVVYLSNDYSLKTRLQSEDRVHRPGQVHKVSYFDVVAVGPNGQKTIDHIILRALRTKDDLANWTTSAWITSLKKQKEEESNGKFLLS
jgi:SNF2 family DNA or RNA helicase